MRTSWSHLLLKVLPIGCLGLLVACGGGGSSAGGGNGGGGGGGGGGAGGQLGPSGSLCTSAAACRSQPAGTVPVLCPASSGPATALVAADLDHVLTRLNGIRAGLGLTAFTRTSALDTFAQNASTQLMNDHQPHAYFNANYPGGGAFTGAGAENQGSPDGWPANVTTTQIDEIIDCFMSEATAPAGSVRGHWETIVCPCYTKIGVGLVKDAQGRLYLSIEFSS